MASDRVRPLTYAFPIVVGALAPGEADADAALTAGAPCYYAEDAEPDPYGEVGDPIDYCSGYQFLDGLTPKNGERIPVDGVLALQATFQGAWDDALLERVAIVVTRDGADVAGTLGRTAAAGLFVWRPEDAWIAGATYDLTATLTNSDVPEACTLQSQLLEYSLTVVDESVPALTPSTLTGEETLLVKQLVSLETLACCPGASPTQYIDMCGGDTVLDFDPAQCTPLSAEMTLSVDLTGSASTTPDHAATVYYELVVDGAIYRISPTPTFDVKLQKPFCATVTAHDASNGASIAGPIACFGDDFAGKLGVQDLEPPGSFTCSLRQCEVDGDAWNLDACTPLDPNHPEEPAADDDDAKGCGCATDGRGGPALALAGALALTLRRRRRR